MSATFDDRWLGLWVCDDGRAVEIRRSADALALSVTDARGASLAELVGTVVAPDPARARDPHSLPNVRMATVRAEVGEGIFAQTWKLYLAALDTAPDARFRYRPARADDDLARVQLLPECDASLLEIVSDDPWTNKDYGTIPWALPYLPFTHASARATPHPLVAPPSSYWKVTVSDTAPGDLTGRAVDAATARSWCELCCGCCGSNRVEITEALDDSGTGWRQLFAVVRCERCGRATIWHYDD